MKIIVNGDVHGTEAWKMIIHEHMDHMIFIGDYFDAYGSDITVDEELENFFEILQIKKDNPEMVTLLVGNHDYHYFEGVSQRYERYQESSANKIADALMSAREHLQMCYVYKDIVFSHAGITKTWCRNNSIDLNDLENSINRKFKEDLHSFGFIEGIGDPNGSDVRQSPIWVRPQQLIEDKIDGYKQVVGHTQQLFHRIVDGVVFIDVPGMSYMIEDADAIDWK